jgi:hypothetical protein
MSLSSWLPSRPRPKASTHELPLFNSPSPADEQTVFPPPPLAASMQIPASTFGSPPSSVAGSPAPRIESRLELPGRAPQGMVWLQRKERELEQELHELLDAQSDALMAGIGGAPPADVSSNGTPSSPLASPQSISSQRERQKPKDLLSVRRAIYRVIRDLTAIKAQQQALVKGALQKSESTLERLELWDHKRSGLQKEIDNIQHEDVEGKTRSLQTEADKLQDEIIEVEQKLNRMRQRHEHLLEQISLVENNVQSRLSTYVTSLNLLNEEIQAWLARPPSPASRQRSRSAEQADFYSLPPSRRTLELAHDHWADEHVSLDKQGKAIRRERRALEHGAGVWKEVITSITGFERSLQKQMSSLNPATSPDSMTNLLASMDDVIVAVEEKLELATKKNWKLLIVCIGAELEAFKQGRDILQQAADQQLISVDSKDDEIMESQYESSQSHIKSPGRPSPSRHSRVASPLDDDSDDGPDPQLLIAKLHSDSE